MTHGAVPAARVIRAPNHLGDVVMAIPALRAGAADVMVARWLAPIVEMALAQPGGDRPPRVLPLDRGRRGWLRAVRDLRAGRYAEGVLLPNSFSSALLFYAGGVRARRGVAADRRAPLLTDPVPPPPPGVHRADTFWRLVAAAPPAAPPVPRLAVPAPLRARWEDVAGAGEGPRVGICPGSHASSRRWDPERFAEVARRLVAEGCRVFVFGGPGEAHLTARVAVRGCTDLGGRTDLPLLAAGLAACDLVVSNDSGPLHLAAALGTRTVSLWGAGDPAVTGPLGEGHHVLRRPDLPCVPCVKNACPRRGSGYLLPDAERECLRLLDAPAVHGAAREQLVRAAAP